MLAYLFVLARNYVLHVVASFVPPFIYRHLLKTNIAQRDNTLNGKKYILAVISFIASCNITELFCSNIYAQVHIKRVLGNMKHVFYDDSFSPKI